MAFYFIISMNGLAELVQTLRILSTRVFPLSYTTRPWASRERPFRQVRRVPQHASERSRARSLGRSRP